MVEAATGDTPQHPLIAIIDSDTGNRRGLRQALERGGYATVEHDSLPDNPAATANLRAVIVAASPRGDDGVESIRRIVARQPDLSLFALAAERTPIAALRQLRRDAWEVISRPVTEEQLLLVVRRAVERHGLLLQLARLKAEIEEIRGHGLVLGSSPAMRVLMLRIERLLDGTTPVCIFGEAGSGKHTVARTVHEMSSRRTGPLVSLDCAITSAANQPAEVLGTERHAAGPQPGCFERAHGGTLVVHNLSEADPATQEAILKLLEHQAVRRVGATRDTPVDVRVVATTTRPLVDEVRGRNFSEGLYQRLEAESLRLAPLRERLEDIPMLVASFMAQMRRDGGGGADRVSADAMELLMRHSWSGNLRELRTVVQRAMLASDSKELRREHLPPLLRASHAVQASPYGATAELRAATPPGTDEVITLRELERREIMKALSHTRGSVAQAARQLGIGRATLYRRLSELNLPPPTRALREAEAARASAKGD